MDQMNYRSGQVILEEDSYYHYELTIIKIGKGIMETLYCNDIYRSTPLPIYHKKIVKKFKDYTLIKTLDWIGAPGKFLKKNHFIPEDWSDYKEFIKEQRKKKKDVKVKRTRKK